MRTSSAGVLLLLAACSPGPDEAGTAPENMIECALAGSSAFRNDCSVEYTRLADGFLVIVRHPDGGFRRLLATEGGNVTPADGAEPAIVTPRGNDIEVAIGSDLYRFALEPADAAR